MDEINNNEINSKMIKKDSPVGPLIGSIIIIIIIILGGLYFWGSVMNEKEKAESNTEKIITEETSQIENELNSIKLDEVDQQLNEIEKEIDSQI